MIAAWGDFDVHFDGVLGRGGMGCVYRAWQRSVGRWVAVKVLNTPASVDPELQQGILQKFQIEIRALARLNDPRIVTILQAGENDARLWFAMEIIDGETVEKRLTDHGAFDQEDAARVGIEVSRALDVALRQKIFHRDVKPANIFLLRDGSVKLADFGLARSAELARTRLTDLDAVACTPEYASPEQADGRATDHRSDLYSLGCVLYEMVTERPPFAGESQMSTLIRHRSEPPLSPRLLNPKVSVEFEAVILRCLEKDPDDRFQHYSDLIDALLPPTEPMFPAARPVVSADPPRSWLWPAAAAAGVTLFVILLLAFYSAEVPSPAAELRSVPPPESLPAPVAILLREEPPKEEPPPPKPPELKPLAVKAKEEKAALEKKAPPDPAAGAAEALSAFRASLASAGDAELIGEIPWGTWNGDLHEAPGGEARFDREKKVCVLTARGDLERAWIKKPFAGAKAGYQVRFRLGSGESPRLALMIALTRWIEFRSSGAAVYRVAADESIALQDQIAFEPPAAEGSVSVIPRASHTLVFLDDRLLFAIPDSECAHADGIRLGAGGGTVFVDSVKAKDRTR